MELRCPSGKLFGIVYDGVLEVRCRSKFCGYEPGIVILHRISLESGETVETKKLRDPFTGVERRSNGNRSSGSPLRNEGPQAHALGS